jgi:hypothetical protein
MKLKKPFSWLGLAIVMMMLILLIPATAAWAAALSLPVSSAKVGDTVLLTGGAFSPSQPTAIYFSYQTAGLGQKIGTDITTYQTLVIDNADTNGGFAFNIVIPAKITSVGSYDVIPGTYRIYACILTSFDPTAIQAVTQITILGNATLAAASPATGAPGTAVTLTGANFLASHALTITFDGTPVTAVSGGTTSAAGAVAATINVPYQPAGAHTITVSDGTTSQSTAFTITPYIAAAPQSGPTGTDVTIAGNGFGAVKSVTVYFNNQQVATTLSSTTGTIDNIHITIPNLNLPAGSYDIKVADSASNLGTAPFQLTVPVQPTPTETATPTPTETATPTPTPTPTVTPDINVLSAGTSVVISGNDFAPNGQIVITVDGEMVGTLTANAAGAFVSQFQVASNLKHGDHTIAVTDGTTTKDYTYTVESTPPDIPVPLAPASGATPKKPIMFEWSPVTDPSAPVTYDLQVASDSNFTASSIVIDKTGLTSPVYTLTADEQAELVGQSTPYYWHIRAVDAASNQSPWTGAMAVHVSAPFNFPTWLIYTMAGVGAVIIFGIGYLAGRRTAFYY